MAPREDAEVHILYVGSVSMQTLQAICDDQRRFIDAYTGWPGSVSDVRMFRERNIYSYIQAQRVNYFEEGQYA